MKGIILSGGTGSRLWPITKVLSKQLLPVYDKPLIYYPVATLMQLGVRNILLITTPHDQQAFQNLLGDGRQWGIDIEYAIQEKPIGLADAFIVGQNFLDSEPTYLILGDNIFHSNALDSKLVENQVGALIFAYKVSDPSAYGVIELDGNFRAISIEEKPENPKSNLAVTGLYFFDGDASERAKGLQPSDRGEIEITSLIETYLIDGTLTTKILDRGSAWLDSGTPQSLNDASNYIRILEERTGQKVGCPEEIAFSNDWINRQEIEKIARTYSNNDYARYLKQIILEKEA
jgi:glucose-1-phosphate thymidylyltransferase